MKKNKVSLIFAVIGMLLFFTGFIWLSVNCVIDKNANNAAEKTVSKLRQLIPVRIDATVCVDDNEEIDVAEVADYIVAPMRDMPIKNVDGVDYIAQLSLLSLNLDLPVASEWSYDTLAISPCRYYGSAYTHNLVILAHNYSHHFGALRLLTEGDEIDITDMDGNVFRYEVRCIETMSPNAVLDMIESDFELSLFTCTADSTMRICVRCSLLEDIPLLLPETQTAKYNP